MLPKESWFSDIVALRREEFGDIKDLVGRPWYQHFERVALRLIFRCPTAGRDQIEAALLHDVLMGGGKGKPYLRSLEVSERAISLIEVTTPPSHANNFRDIDAFSPEDNRIYFDYIADLISTQDLDAVNLKLADIRDTIDSLQISDDIRCKAQLNDRYTIAESMLSEAAEAGVS